MVTRVIGRGRCPKCGREGSVVLKQVGGRVYVYFKHGRSWCYLGPLGSVDLSSILTEVRDYHSLTTKFSAFLGSRVGVGGVRLAPFVVAGALLVITAYSLSTGGLRYAVAVTSITSVTVAVFLMAIATYELGGGTYQALGKVLTRGLLTYALIMFAATFATLIITMPLASAAAIHLMVSYKVSSNPTPSGVTEITMSGASIDLPLNTIILTPLVTAFMARPLRGKARIVTTVTASLATYAALMTPSILILGAAPPNVILDLTTYILALTALNTAITLAYTEAITHIKPILTK